MWTVIIWPTFVWSATAEEPAALTVKAATARDLIRSVGISLGLRASGGMGAEEDPSRCHRGELFLLLLRACNSCLEKLELRRGQTRSNVREKGWKARCWEEEPKIITIRSGLLSSEVYWSDRQMRSSSNQTQASSLLDHAPWPMGNKWWILARELREIPEENF